jgi:hypothetical protein
MARPRPVYIVPRPRATNSCGCLILMFVGVVLLLTAVFNFFGVH